jgi:uncharacterized protein YodC (DUF2158 family)
MASGVITEDSPRFPEGATVYLKSGSPPLIAENIRHDRLVNVVWFVNGEARRDCFHPDALTTTPQKGA